MKRIFLCILLIMASFYGLFYSVTTELYLDLGSCRIKAKKGIFGIKKEEIIESELSKFISENKLVKPENWLQASSTRGGISGNLIFESFLGGKIKSQVHIVNIWLKIRFEKPSNMVEEKLEVTKNVVVKLITLLSKQDLFEIQSFVNNLDLETGNEGPKSTNTYSDIFSNVATKKKFLEEYVNFRREYKSLDFYISYYNGDEGSVPAPSEWNIIVIAEVESSHLKYWNDGMKRTTSDLKKDWFKKLKTTIDYSKINEWYKEDKRIVGVDNLNNIVVYFNSSNESY